MTEVKYILCCGDIARMMEIERLSFRFPWEEDDVKNGILSGGKYRFLGLYENGTLAGWGCFAVFAFEAHLLTIAVHPDFRRKHLGRVLMHGILQAAADAGARYMELECRQNNLTAQSFYKSEGFLRVGRNKGYYSDTGEDALIYVKPDLPEGISENDPYLIRE